MRTIIAIAVGCLLANGLVSFEARNPGALDIEKYSSPSMLGSVFTLVPKSPGGGGCGSCMGPDFWRR
jgi:hypothetical protein